MPTNTKSTHISRRQFLRGCSLITAGGLLAACSLGPENPPPTEFTEFIFSEARLPQDQAALQGTAGQPAAELAGFLALSSVLTGVEQLDPTLGQIYLQSLQEHPDLQVSVGDLLQQAQAGMAAMPTTIEELENSGIFENEATRTLANKITEYWYTGIYETPQGEQVVATFVDALAWKTLTFTKPQTICGSYMFWTEPPESALD